MNIERELTEIKLNQLVIAVALIVIHVDWAIRLMSQ